MSEEGQVIVIYSDHVLSASASVGGVSVPTRIIPTGRYSEGNRAMHPTRCLYLVSANRDDSPAGSKLRGAEGNGDG